MLYTDPIRRGDFLRLAAERGTCLSLFLPTTPVTLEAQPDRLRFRHLAAEAVEQAQAIADKRQIWPMEDFFAEIEEDDDFWAYQALGLAVFATPERVRTYRLPHTVEAAAEVSDRFHLKPLLPALSPAAVYVLAISQKSVAMYVLTGSEELHEVSVPDLPKDFSDVTRRTLQRDRAPVRRLQGDEGARVLKTHFVRAVEEAVRRFLRGDDTPLVIATVPELEAMYRAHNHYEHLANEAISQSTEDLPVESLRQAALPIAQRLRQARLDAWAELFGQRESENRTATDLADLARFATNGRISHLLVDADAVEYGTIADDGTITRAEGRSGESYDLLDEIVVRVLETGGEVLGVRQDEAAPAALMPIAGILRWA